MPQHDLVVHGGKIITLEGSARTVQALGVRDGRIAAAGDTAQVMQDWGPGTRVLDVSGKTVTPGFYDAHPHMDRRRFEKLRRGRLDPEARIDLHGMTSERAHAALTGFILAAHAEGLRLVLVITGKGRADAFAMQPHRHGILRHSLPHWLAAPPLNARILQLAPAHQRHGGAGAFYVYLRRQRP